MAKKLLTFSIIVLLLSIALFSCKNVKPYYDTKDGKKKNKYYNNIQYKNWKKKEHGKVE